MYTCTYDGTAYLQALAMSFVSLIIVQKLTHSLNFCKLGIYLVSPLRKQLVSFLLSIIAVTPVTACLDNDN